MRNLTLAAMLLFTMTACGGGGAGKFEGKWKPTENNRGMDKNTIMKIQKEGKVYKLFKLEEDGTQNNSMSFLYDEDRDALTMDMGQQIMDIEYNKEKKTIKMGPRGGGGGWGNQTVELERAK